MKNKNWKPWGRGRGEAAIAMALNGGPRSNLTLLTSSKPVFFSFFLGPIRPRASRQGGQKGPPGRGLRNLANAVDHCLHVVSTAAKNTLNKLKARKPSPTHIGIAVWLKSSCKVHHESTASLEGHFGTVALCIFPLFTTIWLCLYKSHQFAAVT